MKKICIAFILTKQNRNSITILTGALEQNEKTTGMPIFFINEKDNLEKNISKLSNDFNKVIVAHSFTTLNLIKCAKNLKNIIDLKLPNLINIAGGTHTTGEPKEVLSMGFDYVFTGEGEETLPEFLDCMSNGKDPLTIKGVAGIIDGKFHTKGRAKSVEIEKFPSYAPKNKLYSFLEITRGCPVACTYCQTSYIFGGRFRHRSADYIQRTVKELVQMGTKDILCLTPDSLSYGSDNIGEPRLDIVEDMLKKVHQVIENRKFYFGTFPSEVWPKSASKEGFELIKRFTHNKSIAIGAQTGSDKMLAKIGRSHTPKDVLKAAELSVQFGFETHVDFLFGFPDETEEDNMETIRLMRELAGAGSKVHSHILLPLPGTPMSKMKPSVVSDKIIKELEKLAGSGAAFGTWKAQKELAEKVYIFRETLRDTKDLRKAISESEKKNKPS